MDVDEDYDVATTSGDDGIDDEVATNNNPSEASQLTGRFKRLGFYPQKEIFCNKYLPYADQLDDESQLMLGELKEFLARSVACREMTPAIGTAIARLMV